MPPVVLPVAEYAPDLPAYVGGASGNILNVYPRTPQSYGPIPSASSLSYGALNGRCQGAVSVIDGSSNVYHFAGTATDLYYLTAGTGSWANASKVAGGYGVASDRQWQFTYFNGDVIAVNITDPPQYFVPGTSTRFADLPGSPPSARYVGVIKNTFVMLGDITDYAQRIQWCEAGNARNWPTPGSTAAAQAQAGATDLLGSDGSVQGIVGDLLSADGAVFQQYAVRRLMYVGPPLIFDLLPVEGVLGTPAPASITVYGGVAFYLAQDGFRAFNGSESRSIGLNKVDRTFFGMIDATFYDRIIGAVDMRNRLIWWLFAGPQNTNGIPNYAMIYNPALDRWSIAEVTLENIFRMLSIGYTLDELYTVLGYTLDTLPAPLDSPLWSGGQLQLGVFDNTHTMAALTGTPMAATVETSDAQPAQGRRVFIGRQGTRPYIDGASPTPTVAVGHRERLADSVSWSSDVAMNGLGICPARASGRYVRARVKVPAGSGTWSNISGVEIDAVPQGTR